MDQKDKERPTKEKNFSTGARMSRKIEATIRYCRLDNLDERHQSEKLASVELIKKLKDAGIVKERQFACGSDEIMYQLIFEG